MVIKWWEYFSLGHVLPSKPCKNFRQSLVIQLIWKCNLYGFSSMILDIIGLIGFSYGAEWAMKNWVQSIVLGVAAIVLFSASSGAAPTMVPHRAVYDLTLVSARSGTGVSSVTGEMMAEWTESCEGWALAHRTLFDIAHTQGRSLRLTSSVATWESRDGLQYHFDITNAVNGKVTEKFEGRAQLDEKHRGGQVYYITPTREPLMLSPGTVFPMVHTERVLAAIQNAPAIRSMVVFDGMSEHGSSRVSAVIGKPSMAGNSSFAALKDHRSWPLQLAYFSVNSPELEPEHEVGMRIYENGVSDWMLIDFGEFVVKADLKRLNYGKRPNCKD
jgi:hypothetical protein